jgi:hypothetical protein
LIVVLMNCFHHGDFWIEFWGTAVVPVPSSTYCTHGAVKYWEYAQQYLGGYGITLRCACTVVYVLYSWYCDVLGVRQYLGGYGITLRCVCTIIYVLYSWCCQVLGVRTTVPWRFPYNSSMYCTHVFCFRCVIVHDCIFWLSISLPPLLLLS